jgi:uncharacterized protein YcgI (DUF1989 family)
MSAKIIFDQIVPARQNIALELHNGETLRVIDAEGKQVVDLVALNETDKGERLSCVYSNFLNATWKLTTGHKLYSNKARPIFSITEDKVGLHYTGGGFCTAEINYLRFKVENTPNCADNLTQAFKPYGIQRDDFGFDSCFNIFMNLTYQPDGSLKLDEPLSKPGDYIDLKAEMDSIVAISNCPQDRNPCNAFNPTPIQVQIFNK